MSANHNPSVLILGNPDDAHIVKVVSQLSRMGLMSCVIGPPAEKQSPSIVCRFSGRSAKLTALDLEGRELALNRVTAVWWRLKPSVDLPGSEADRLSSDFCTREWRHTLEALEVVLADAKWINPRPVDRRIRYKPAQLLLARQNGFETPDTIVSNDPGAIAGFLNDHDGAGIYKPLTWFFEPPDKILFTNPVNTAFIDQNSTSVRRAPGIFQPPVPKAYELRITVVGERMFPVRIDSQKDKGARLDWRRKQLDLSYQPCQLRDQFQESLLQFHRSLGLVYGAYDFIVTPDAKEVFLEVNPAGQWLWIEELTGCPICQAVASELA